MKATETDVIGLDSTVDMEDGKTQLKNDISIQGNVIHFRVQLNG